MAKWKTTIRLTFDDSDPDNFRRNAAILGKTLKRRVVHLLDWELKDLIEEFLDIADLDGSTPGATVKDFDDALSALYDWGDRDHRLWVEISDKERTDG